MRADKQRKGFRWHELTAVAPGFGASLLPVGACPVCWPAYAGVLSAVGLGFLLEKTYLLAATGAFLLVAVASLAYQARSRRGYGPFVLGAFGSAVALSGKFALSLDSLLYLGLALLVGASLWNAWPRPVASSSCSACRAEEPGRGGPRKHPGDSKRPGGGHRRQARRLLRRKGCRC